MSLRSRPGRARILVGAIMVAAPFAMPVAAQDSPPANAAPPSSTNTVGPRELRDFNLPGQITQPAAPQPQTLAPATPTRDNPPAAAAERPAGRPSAPAPTNRSTDADPAPRVADDESFPDTAAPVASAPAAASAPEPQLVPAPAADVAPEPSGGLGWWPWLLALTAALGAAWWWVRRKQPPAAAGLSSIFATREPAPAAPRPAPTPMPAATPAPRPSAALDGGIVSRRLQPKIMFEFTPLRIDLDADGNAGLIYDLVIVNVGSAPAREVLVEARMFNAGPEQDREIAAFFNAPQALGERVPLIAPQQRLPVRSRVLLYSDRFAPIEVEGRKLLVPMVAFNALYRGPDGESQNSASFLVGRVPQGEAAAGKMAPFRLDKGARQWSDLGTRPHSGGAG